MTPQGRSRRLAALTTAVLAAACALAPSAGAKFVPSNGDLSSRLAELAKPSVRTAPPGEQAAILDVAASGPGSLLREGSRVLVDVRFDRGAIAGVGALREAGAKVIDVSGRYQTVTAAVAPGLLRKVADVPRVSGITENLAPFTFGAGDSGPAASTITHCFGVATSEGDIQLNAMLARDAFSVDGTGVTVGILSDSFDKDATAPTSADQDVVSGDLPGLGNPCGRTTPVDESGDTYVGDDGSDEGRAMAQIVHDLAPGARIAFATAFNSLTNFANNVRALRDAGARVIVDDVIWLNEPFFQEGPVGVAVRDVTATGVAYFTSAGNSNLIVGGRNIASWETEQFRDGGGSNICPPALTALLDYVDDCIDFDSTAGMDGDFSIRVQAGRTLTIDLQWAQPWEGVTTDIDAYLLDATNAVVAGSEEDNVRTTRQPVEIVSWENTTGTSQDVRLAINRCSGTCNPGADSAAPRVKFALLQNGSGVTSTEYPQSVGGDIVGPTIFGHSGAEHAMSVGAVRFNTSSAPEAFSSRGPVKHYFGPVNGTTPAGSIPEKVLAKPDIVATDGGANTFFGTCSSNIWRFFGTSASAPHAAAVAALEFEASPASSPAAIKDAQVDNALPIAGFPPAAVGEGIVDGFAAIESLVGSLPGSQVLQSTAPNCNLPPPPPPPPTTSPDPPPSTVFSAPSPKSKPKDRIRPKTFIAKKPAKVSFTWWKRKLITFRFRSSEKRSAFLCKIDRGKFHQCYRKLIRWFPVGKHVLKVKARDAAGNVDRTPAVYRFQIKRRG